jgi:hypothetical protein
MRAAYSHTLCSRVPPALYSLCEGSGARARLRFGRVALRGSRCCRGSHNRMRAAITFKMGLT